MVQITYGHIVSWVCPYVHLNQGVSAFNVIGRGRMEVKNAIHKGFNDIKYVQSFVYTDRDIKYPEYTNSVWVHGKDQKGYWPGKYKGTPLTVLLLEDEVCSTETYLIRSDGYHPFTLSCLPRLWGNTVAIHQDNIEYNMYDSVICFGHQHSADWGHFMLEVVPCFIFVPKEVLANSMIAFNKDLIHVHDWMSIFGVRSEQLIFGIAKPFYAKKLYIAKNTWCGDLNRFPLVAFKQFIVNKFDLNKVKPHRFTIYNRNKQLGRTIENIDELMNISRMTWPQYKWELVEQKYHLADQILYFNEIMLIFAIHGSILANELFMQENTIAIEVQTTQWLLSFINLGPMTGIYQILGRDNNFQYKGSLSSPFDPSYYKRLVTAGLEQAHLI